jgi:hypothetical protein
MKKRRRKSENEEEKIISVMSSISKNERKSKA